MAFLNARRRQTYQSGTKLGDRPTGSIVRIAENGTFHNFVVAQHNYIQAGVTAVERELCLADTVAFNLGQVNTYDGGGLDALLTGEYRNRFDPNVRNALVMVNIPIIPGNGNANVTTISRDVFAFSGTEMGAEHQYLAVDGSRVSIYTDDASRVKRSDIDSITACRYWTRSAVTSNTGSAWSIAATGEATYGNGRTAYNFAPVLALQSSTPINDDLTIT